jgi:hypothetical protein
VACGVVYAAARRHGVPLPEDPPWWTVFDADEAGIQEVCRVLAHLYSLPKAQYIPVYKDNDSFTVRRTSDTLSSKVNKEYNSKWCASLSLSISEKPTLTFFWIICRKVQQVLLLVIRVPLHLGILARKRIQWLRPSRTRRRRKLMKMVSHGLLNSMGKHTQLWMRIVRSQSPVLNGVGKEKEIDQGAGTVTVTAGVGILIV